MLKRWIGIALILWGLVGCRGTVQFGVEQTPTPDLAPQATWDALVAENQRLATQVAAQVSSMPPSLSLGQVAYVQGGDIWVMPLFNELSRPHRLTIDGRNREPRWSASGQWLAFHKERPTTLTGVRDGALAQQQVWVIKADSTGEHALNEGQPVDEFVWSPSGARLAYTTSAGGLFTVNADGSNLITLIKENTSSPVSELQVGRVLWNPAGTRLAYERRYQPTSRSWLYQGLWMSSPNGGEPSELYSAGIPDRGEVALAGWSTTGDDVLFWQNRTAGATLDAGGQLYKIPASIDRPPNAIPERIAAIKILVYPDFVVPAPRASDRQDQRVVAYIAGEGQETWKNKRVIVDGRSITNDDLAAISSEWSPDGHRLAFSAMPARDDLTTGSSTDLMLRRLWVADVVGGTSPVRLTDAVGYRDERPRWSADGRYLLFARLDARGRASLWIISSDGGFPRQVVDELTPTPDSLESFGHIDWGVLYDWWRGP